jgi:zinc and cadmium transporter
MTTILWIITFGLLMSLIALDGGFLLFLTPAMVDRMLLPLVAFAAGSLVGGAMFHMIPHAVEKMGNTTGLYVWLMAGFVVFMGLEQFLNWHHSHTHSHTCGPFSPPHKHNTCPSNGQPKKLGESSETYAGGLDSASDGLNTPDIEMRSRWDNDVDVNADHVTTVNIADGDDRKENEEDSPHTSRATSQRKSLGYLILLADAVHNFLGGLFVGAAFVDSTSLGISSWTAAALHEVPQELGDFAILVHGGWSKPQALLYNFLSALTFPLGGILVYATSRSFDVSFLIPFAAGNFLYIGASDLIPEIKHFHGLKTNALHFGSFLLGAGILLAIRIAVVGWN